MKRPHLSIQKPKPRQLLQKAQEPPDSNPRLQEKCDSDLAIITLRSQSKNTLADWTADVEDGETSEVHTGLKRQRGGRKKRKKPKVLPSFQDWDDIYDPTRPNSYEEYKSSNERIGEIREWKDRLYTYRTARLCDSDFGDFEEDYRLSHNSMCFLHTR